MSYWKNLITATQSVIQGLVLTWRQFRTVLKPGRATNIRDHHYFENANGTATISYPEMQIPIPDVGRYKLHNEIDDCIVCDKCAVVCPVDCITIEPVRAPEVFGKTSDGTAKRIHAAKFDIDMSKCCFCGLCTTVCPTECLTMTPEFDFSVSNIKEHTFAFSILSEKEVEEKKKQWEQLQIAKEEQKNSDASQTQNTNSTLAKTAKPVMKPIIKPPSSSQS
jgi:formate hydrogenlyase subunit 6/NADH:ubiquinone oxidoreductase subunit I